MCKRSLDADAAVAGAAAGETIATQQFTAQFEKQIGGRDPAQLHAVIEELVAEERLTDQRPVAEEIGMGVVRVEVTEVGKESLGAQCQATGQTEGVDRGLLGTDAFVAANGQGDDRKRVG